MGYWMQTYSGDALQIDDPTLGINLRDIAVSLARRPRFGGHTEFAYSVAQHSVLVASLVPADFKLQALMHDAHEAYLGDMIRPVAEALGSEFAVMWQAMKDRFDAAIAQVFGFEWTDAARQVIEKADEVALATEQRDLFVHRLTWGALRAKPADIAPIIPWAEHASRLRFVSAFNKYARKDVAR